MTLDEAVNQSLEQIAGLCKAMQVAGRNGGKPIFDPKTGQPVNLQGPPMGNILLTMLSSMSVLLQAQRATAGMLAGGFNLSDQEAGRIADLLMARIQALDSPRPAAVGLEHENVPSADSSQSEGTEGHQ